MPYRIALTASLLCLLALTISAQRQKTNDFADFLNALTMVESGGNPSAYNPNEKAIGVLQIRPIMVAEYNRLTGQSAEHVQAWHAPWSFMLAETVLRAYADLIAREQGVPATWQQLAYCWNGGLSARHRVAHPRRDPKQINLERYWQKVRVYLE